jgi:hypothetical protein
VRKRVSEERMVFISVKIDGVAGGKAWFSYDGSLAAGPVFQRQSRKKFWPPRSSKKLE